MALNPQLFPNGMPVPFVNEIFVLARDGVEFEIDKIPGFVSDPTVSLSFGIQPSFLVILSAAVGLLFRLIEIKT